MFKMTTGITVYTRITVTIKSTELENDHHPRY